jgi:prepilin-type N-terminal cleavage/methylation domain-containing protein
MKRRPFTMLELLAVMTILSVLIGITFGVFPMITKWSKDAKTRAHLKIIEVALEQYNKTWGYYPQATAPFELTSSWLDSLVDKSRKRILDTQKLSAGVTLTSGKKTYVDAYSEGFYYECPGTMLPEKYDLWSRGKDRFHGGAASATATDAQKNDAATLNCDDLTNWRQGN